MQKIKLNTFRYIGIIGTIACLALFIRQPSFPTPDKLLFFLTFVFMIYGHAIRMLKRLLPFVALLLVYESFRGIAPHLNTHVNYSFAPRFDQYFFGDLPTHYLQSWLWHGSVSWYDFVFYIPYMLFFVLPLALALLVWKTRDEYYWRVVSTYVTVFFGGFLTFLIFPAAPPWMASQNNYIEPIVRVSSHVWYALGVKDFPSLYNHIAPNPVAAIPSLHSAAATLLSIFIFKIYGKRWGYISLIYPALIFVGVMYQGEHYFFDVFAGICYAFIGYLVVAKLYPKAEAYVKLHFNF